MKQDLGQILEKAVRQSGYPISKLAKKIGYTRQHIYNLFTQQHINIELLMEIGKIINVDFKQDIKLIKNLSQPYKITEQANENYKEKYIHLLEEYNTLLKEHHQLIKDLSKKHLQKNK